MNDIISYKIIKTIEKGDCKMKPLIIPEDVKIILKTLNEQGYEAYIVGGCVRDCILNRIPQDWDITTSAKPSEVKEYFLNTYDTGIQHGTVTVVFRNQHYEITTYRIEGLYEDYRRPKEVFFTSNLKEDLLRRDFTMNAIAYHPNEGFQDPFSGMKDIKNKLIKGVGVASERFQEDALRMLRAIRFSAQLGFEIEEKTYYALCENIKLIEKISVERIKEETEKLILADFAEKTKLLWETGLIIYMFPKWYERIEQNGIQIIQSFLKSEKNSILRWTLLIYCLGKKEAEKFLKYLKFDTKTLRIILSLVENLKIKILEKEYFIRKMLCEIGIEEFKLLLKLKSAVEHKENIRNINTILFCILERQDCIFLKQLCINGEDLFYLGIEKGKRVGLILNDVLDFVHKNPNKNNKEDLICYVKEKFL